MKRLIFTLAGISWLDEKKGLLGKGKKLEGNLKEIEKRNIKAIITNNDILKNQKKQVLDLWAGKNIRDSISKFSAEIASLYYLKPQALDNKDDKIILLLSETQECAFSGLVNGKFIIYRRTENKEWDSITFDTPTSDGTFHCDNVELKIIEGLQVKDIEKFRTEGVKNLFDFVSTKINEEGDLYDEIIVNITGGFKGTIPYFTLFGMLHQESGLNSNKCEFAIKYLYEESEDIITLPNLPVAFDLPTWRDYRGLIRAVKLLSKEQANVVRQILPPQIRELFELQHTKYELNPFGNELQKRYEKEKIVLTPHGKGLLLLDKIKNPLLREYLTGCINQWQHLWIGDKIPEMVEHARGHTQRVLEIAAELLYPIFEENENFLNDVELSSLIGAIWLHDLGNSGEKFICGKEYLVKDFPSLIRDFHNLITYTILEEEKEEIFPERTEIERGNYAYRNKIDGINNIIENIKVISKYHRKWTPLTQNQINDEHKKHCIKLEDAVEDRAKLQFLTALYRVLDACDTQLERTVDDAYIATRKNVVNREVRILLKEKEDLECGSEIQNFIDKVDKNQFKECSDRDLNSLKSGLNWIFSKEDKETEVKIDKYADCINNIVGNIKTCSNSNIYGTGERWLSCLDKIFFKKRQPIHYEKHRGISAVMILPEGKEEGVYEFTILMVGAEKTDEQVLRDVLEDDIFSEYKEVKKVLDPFIKFKLCYQCYSQEIQCYKDYSDETRQIPVRHQTEK